jgi:uncharacterized damage-inducible protein DinB
MSTRTFYLERLKAEGPAFAKVIRALPADRSEYRPHPKSRSAGELAWMLATSMEAAAELAEKHKVEWTDPSGERGVAAAADAIEHAQLALVKRAAGLKDEAWGQEAQFLMGGQVVWKGALGEMLWGFLFDSIHHRGQLSTYIRPMGGKVPAIYGPSADDPGQ